VYRIYKYLVYIPWLLLWTLLNFSGVVIVAPFSPRLASRWFGGSWGRGLMRAVPSRVQVSGAGHIDPGASYVLVANHLSLMDIPLLYGWLPLDLKWIMKKEVRKIPIIGIGTAMMGHIFLDRHNHEAAMRELEHVKQKLQAGTSILFFPEGTRSRDGQLKDFKMGAFRMAKDLDIPVLPISIKGTENILTPDGMDLHPGRAEVVIHPAIAVEEVRSSGVESLRDRARTQIASVL
jgi:1-acyl-sn-glycerol-3-phosphate acyltransferase